MLTLSQTRFVLFTRFLVLATPTTRYPLHEGQGVDLQAELSSRSPDPESGESLGADADTARGGPSTWTPGTSVVALFGYTAEYPDDLSFREGDVVIFTGLAGNGWCTGKMATQGVSGMFPASFVEPLSRELQARSGTSSASGHSWPALRILRKLL